jgi:hypothetical protein
MEKSPTNLDAKMSDVSLAHNLIAEIAGHCWRGRGDMLDRVHDALRARHPKWTRRRVRAFWHREAAGVRYHEMIELLQVAEIERGRREELERARQSHAAFLAETARLAALLERQDEAFHGDQIANLRSGVGGMDLPGAHQ